MSALPPVSDEDAELLASFQAGQCEEAFRALVERHLPLVWSVARRVLVSCPSLVEDAAQIVFTDLAHRALKLRADAPLGGWLHRHTWFTATKLLRSELRRSAREATAAMNAQNSLSEQENSSETWSVLAPQLDAALANLSAGDREAVVQRFFEEKNFREVGLALGVGEEAARKRVGRAVEILRRRLCRRGAAVPTAAVLVAAFASGRLVAAPPPGMSVSVSRGAWARRGVGGASAVGNLKQWFALIRHSPWVAPVAGVSVIVAALAVWWSVTFPARFGNSVLAAARPSPPPSLLPAGDPLRAEIVIFNVEDSLARAVLRQREADGDDAALFQRLDVSAAPPPDLKNLVAPGTQPVLGPVVKSATLVGECRSGREAALQDIYVFKYGTEFSPPNRRQAEMLPTAFHTRGVGTEIKFKVGARHVGGMRSVAINFTHHYAAPAMRLWPVQVRDDGTASEIGAGQPDIQVASGEISVVAPPGQWALASSLLLPLPLVTSDPPASPRRLLIFVTLQEGGSRPQ